MQNDFHLEIEKKYLVKKLPDKLEQYESVDILQGYISNPNDDVTVRLRKYGCIFFKTIKKRGFLSRLESETQISEEQFNNEWNLTEGKRIKKIRYKIPYNSLIIELDIFQEKLDGLIIAEVEFRNEDESLKFIPPDWFGEEVTDQREFSNSYLSFFGYKKNIQNPL